jgi:quinol monooxygenase YgiN
MTVIVVVQRRARTGQAEALIAAAQRRWARPWPAGRRHVRLFQGTAEPERILFVGEWDSAERYWASRRDVDTSGLDALCVTPAPPQVYDWRWRYQNLARRPGVLSVVTLRVPPDALAATVQYVEDARAGVREAAGLVLHLLCQNPGDPGQLLILQGWATPEAMAAHRRETAPVLQAAHQARGVQVDIFVGQPRGDEDQWASLAPGQGAGGGVL